MRNPKTWDLPIDWATCRDPVGGMLRGDYEWLQAYLFRNPDDTLGLRNVLERIADAGHSGTLARG